MLDNFNKVVLTTLLLLLTYLKSLHSFYSWSQIYYNIMSIRTAINRIQPFLFRVTTPISRCQQKGQPVFLRRVCSYHNPSFVVSPIGRQPIALMSTDSKPKIKPKTYVCITVCSKVRGGVLNTSR